MQSRLIQGVAVAPGLAVGPAHVVHAGPSDVPTWTIAREEVTGEVARLAAAMNSASELLEERQKKVAQSSGQKDAEIFAVHRMILQDPGALREVEQAITDERINAEAAVQRLIRRFESTMSGLEGDSVRAYASDVSDPWRGVLDMLMQRDREEILHSDERVVLAAAELTPKVVTFLERERILGVVCESGGRFSHGAVLARSFGLPCVIGVPNLLTRLEQGMLVALDGDRGTVVLRPDEDQVAELLEQKRAVESHRQLLEQEAGEPSVTPDGQALGTMVNLESIRDFDTFDLAHVDGVGLLRTEFLYMERGEFPSEEEQYRMYRRILERLDGREATFRTLDIGGDKPLPYFQTPPEPNPALGWRGLRVTLRWRDLLRVQLRAFLRAAPHGNLRAMLPMVTSLEELREVHEMFTQLRQELIQQGYEIPDELPVGTMIEVPSMLFILEQVMEEVDFVSVGTNDLVQYLLAVDRDNAWVAESYDPQHPAVIAALHRIGTAAQAAGKPASVCGDVAGDPAMAIVLFGMGYASVSVAPQFAAEVKFAIRRTTSTRARELAREVLSQDRSEDVRAVLSRFRGGLYGKSAAPRGA